MQLTCASICKFLCICLQISFGIPNGLYLGWLFSVKKTDSKYVRVCGPYSSATVVREQPKAICKLMGVAVLHKINSLKQVTVWIYLAGHSLQTSDFRVSSLINELNKIFDMCPLVLPLNLYEDHDLTFFIFKLSFNSHFVFRLRSGGKLNFILIKFCLLFELQNYTEWSWASH